MPGEEASYGITLHNKGIEAIADWRLRVLAVKAPERYVSRIRDAQTVGEIEIPRLGAGESRALEVPVTAPGPGEWMLLFDARDGGGMRAAELGSPPLQVRLDVSEPPSTPEPSVSPSPAPAAG